LCLDHHHHHLLLLLLYILDLPWALQMLLQCHHHHLPLLVLLQKLLHLIMPHIFLLCHLLIL
jgi:hypothetical protein